MHFLRSFTSESPPLLHCALALTRRHDMIYCERADDNGYPTLLFRFTFTADQRSVTTYSCAWCAAQQQKGKRGQCDLVSHGRHKLVMDSCTQNIALEIGKPPKSKTRQSCGYTLILVEHDLTTRRRYSEPQTVQP